VPLRDLGLLASEGRMTIPLEDGSAEGVLAVHASFFEFIPEDRIESPSPPVLLAHDLEEGHRYYLILSGGNGLYRYDMNDVVQVRGFHGRTPRLAFVRKGRDMVSITGEKLHLNQVQAAVREAEDQTKLDVWQFRLVPDVEGRRYDLLVEPRGALADAQGLAFLEAFDQALARLNVEYASKRASKRLGPPRLAVMRPGWSERECRADFQAGKRELQHKWPVMRLEWDVASRQAVLRTLERP
jgi:GH3 auxin-responsive promoter